jgi:hypothetical protein
MSRLRLDGSDMFGRVKAVEARHDVSRCGQSGCGHGTAVESRSGLAGWVPTRSVMAVN